MFMKVINEVIENDIRKGFMVVLFDNRKGGKDHNVKISTDIRQVFARVQRDGWVTSNPFHAMPGSDDVQFARFHNVPPECKGYKIEDVKFELVDNTEGRQGRVTARISPFGPQYLTLREALEKKEEMNFTLSHLYDQNKAIHKVLGVVYKARTPAMAL